MKKPTINPICQSCDQAYKSINGARCKKLDTPIEYTQTPPCTTTKTPQQ